MKSFIMWAMICGFCISADYAIIRPVSNAVFLTAYGSQAFPYAWLAIVPLNFLVVALYNRYLPRWGCRNMFFAISACIVLGNLFSALFLRQLEALPFIYYIWKEVYILLMFQQLWSIIHGTIQQGRAKYLYGLIFAVGGAGGALGSSIPTFLAVDLGSENLLFFSIPIYLILTFAYTSLLRHSQKEVKSELELSAGSLKEGLKTIGNSKPLIFILLIVLFMQVASTVTYHQFNTLLEATIGDKDLRTEYCGWVFGIVNISTIFLQVVGSSLLVHFLGLRRSHLAIPCILCVGALGSFFSPTFPMISFAYATIKTFDFSLFGVIKEMLYIPMRVEEKFQAKAIIDVFVYRSAKALASLLILALQFLQAPFSAFSWGLIILFILWAYLVIRMFKLQEEPALAK
jgi:AAA family ATP:ADP antiporter